MPATITIRPPPPSPAPPVPIPSIPSQPVPFVEHIGKSGQDALWAGFVVFVISTLLFSVVAARLQPKHRVFHFLILTATGVGALSYYAMATNVGTSYVSVGWHHIQGAERLVLRQVFWARYVDWAISTPILVFVLTLLAGFPWISVLSLAVVSQAGILVGLIAGLQHNDKASTWGWYAIGCLLFVYLIFHLLWNGRKSAKHQHDHVSSLYTKVSIYIVTIWVVYLVIFALSLTGHLNPDKETIAYTVLDIFVKTVFGIWVLIFHKHDSEEAAVCLSESWTEHRGARRGLIHLPGGEEN